MELEFTHQSFGKRLSTMLKVDFRRMFTMPLLYIAAGSCLVMPILILVMTTMFGGTAPAAEAQAMGGFTNTWQAISSYSDAGMLSMDLTGMCNINMLYFFIAVLVCVFVAQDFRSGYAKNLFTVRVKKTDYAVSKTLVCFVGGMLMLLAFFVGASLGGAIAGLPFDLRDGGNLVMCMASKLLLALVFVPIYLLWSVAAKQKLWLSLVGSMVVGMFLFMMIPMLTPLDATIMNVALCLAGGVLASAGLGAISSKILKKTSLV